MLGPPEAAISLLYGFAEGLASLRATCCEHLKGWTLADSEPAAGVSSLRGRSNGETVHSGIRISEESSENRGAASVASLQADNHSGLSCDIKFRSHLASTTILLLSCGG